MSKIINPNLINNLVFWGAWRRGEVKGLESLGFPDMTPCARLYNSPGKGSLPSITPNYMSDRQAVWVDKRLDLLINQQRNAIWCRYVQYMDDLTASGAMGTTIEGFRQLLDKSLRAAADALNMRFYIWSGDPERHRKKKY